MDEAEGEAESFETLYRELEETVAGLEQGGLTLEEALDRFEHGVRLVDRCTELLDQAELRVTRLLADDVAADEGGADESVADARG